MKRPLQHIFFWVVILIFQVTRSNPDGFVESYRSLIPIILEHFTMLPILIAASYFTADYVFPKFFYTKRYVSFFIIMGASCLFFVLLMRAYLFYLFFPEFYKDINNSHPSFFSFNISQHIFYIYSTVAIVVMMKYVRRINKIEDQRRMLEKQNITSELALLRSQVSPHFLFNTLNNINALTTKDAQKTYQSVIKLSEIMRYMLQEVKNDEILLVKEIEYLNSYIGLLQLRVDDNKFIQFNIDGPVENVMIAPMLFVPLVENAFKHGRKDVESPGVTVNIWVKNQTLTFEVVNYIKNGSIKVDTTSGIGIPNLRRRLELLYPNSHTFRTEIIGDKYKALLSINLK